MNLRINYPNFIRRLLPPYRRQFSRLALLKGFIEPFQVLFREFNVQRGNPRMMINVSSQVKVPEEYLRKEYDEPVRIKVVTYNNVLLLVDLLNEGHAMQLEFGLIGENCFQSVPLGNEVRDKSDGVDFIVYIPFEIDKILIETEIKKHKQILTTHKIIQK